MITISRVYIHLKDHPKILAKATVYFQDCFVVNNILIIQGNNDVYVAMPNKKRGDKFVDICCPINSEFRKYLDTTILDEYIKVKEANQPVDIPPSPPEVQ